MDRCKSVSVHSLVQVKSESLWGACVALRKFVAETRNRPPRPKLTADLTSSKCQTLAFSYLLSFCKAEGQRHCCPQLLARKTRRKDHTFFLNHKMWNNAYTVRRCKHSY